MEAKLKERWLHELRSGEIEQAKGVLRTVDNEFCCLGVLCNIINPDAWGEVVVHQIDSEEDEDIIFVKAFLYDQPLSMMEAMNAIPYTFLSQQLLEYLGLDKDVAQNLARRNDDGCTFSEIADMIESEVE